MKKRHLLLGLLLVSGIVSLTACNWGDDPEVETTTYTVTFETNGGSTVASQTTDNGSITAPSNPTKSGFIFKGWYADAAFSTPVNIAELVVSADITLYAKWEAEEPAVITYTATFETNGGSTIAPQVVSEDDFGYYTVQRPEDPTYNYKTFDNWYADEACTELFDFSNPISSNVTIYAKWNSSYEMVASAADFDAAAAVYPGKTKPTTDVTFGKFTFGAGVYFEAATSSKTACVNNQQKDISFKLSGKTNKIDFNIKFGSSSGSGTVTLYKLVNGEKVEKSHWVESGQKDYSIDNLEAGDYVFGSVGSFRFYSLVITEELETSAPTGIEIATMPQVDFLEGREFASQGLAVYLTYANGRKDIISDFEVDSTAYQTTPGNYTISISYELTDEYATYNFDTNYEVSVYEAVSISYGDHILNTSRVTLPLEQVFLTGSTFTSKNLAVIAKGLKVGTDNVYVDFVLTTDEYSLSNVDTTQAGSQTVTITAFEDITNSYVINVVNKVLDENSSSANIVVDAAGTLVVSNESIVFNKVNDALRYLELCKVADSVTKTITVKAGSYFEKVEVKLPNVRLIGENSETTETVIWYNVINGMNDPSGTTSYSTDGSATVSIRETAVGFYAQDITFKNYYNTHALYLESLKISSDSQAVACLVQADQSAFKNVKFTSYHDTLYAQVGRQYYENCYIEGRTDYIFGYNATAYFLNCDIHSIGAGVDQNNGGYVVATKGASGMKYGYVFNECNFDGDENVQDGSVSIARGWDTNMTIMVMNSTISGKFSKEYYGNNDSPLNDRYGKMNAAPNPALLLEYNNTGAGAIKADDQILVDDKGTEDKSDDEYVSLITKLAEKTCTVVTDVAAIAGYDDLLQVFAPVNGTSKTTYSTNWKGLETKDAEIVVMKGETVVLETMGYVGAVLTTEELKAITSVIVCPDGYELEGIYADAELTTKFAEQALTATTVIYIKLQDKSPKTALPAYDGTVTDSKLNTWSVSSVSGTCKVSPTVGNNTSATDVISVVKLDADKGDSITSPVFEATKKISLEILSASTKTSKEVGLKIELLAADGTVVATNTIEKATVSKTTTKVEVEYTTETAFVQIRVSCATATINIGVYSITGYRFEEAKQSTTYGFSSLTSAPLAALPESNSVITYVDNNDPKKHALANNTTTFGDVSYTNCLSTGGGSSSTNNITIVIPENTTAVITMIVTNGGGSARWIDINTSIDKSNLVQTYGYAEFTADDKYAAQKVESVKLEAGTYYINYSNGVRIYDLQVVVTEK